ncbi:MAG TPA: PEP-CTERM system histidine kinase PrsK, partial [Cellvibrio sp.]|nr:PEP-CTERM system histidine kinase PrsK [Cellvibrio sp.]
MEYNSVTFAAYFSAAVVSALLTATFLFQLVRKQKTWLFAGAAAVHTLHLGAIALSFSDHPIPLYLLIIFEYLHFNAWVFCISLSLKRNAQRKQLPTSLQLLFSGGWPITALAIAMLFIPNMNQVGLSVWFALGLAVIALVSVEQLYRYAAENDRQIKLLSMNLA